MKKIALLIFMLSTVFSANAKCLYSLKHEALLFQGYTINFGTYLENAISPKGYERTFEETNLEVIPHFSLAQVGHFEEAISGFSLRNSNQVQTQNSVSKRCYTQTCAVSDARKVIVIAIKDFAKKLKICNN